MKLNIRGQNINVTDDLREVLQSKFDRLDKYFHEEEEMDLTLSIEGIEKRVESTIFLKGGTILRAEENSEDFLDSADMCVDSLVRQIRKHKTKLQRNRRSGESIKFESFGEDSQEEESTSKIVRHKRIFVKPMSDEEAVLQMELLNHDFFVFLDDVDMEVRVVYKRRDGNYGEIIPSMK